MSLSFLLFLFGVISFSLLEEISIVSQILSDVNDQYSGSLVKFDDSGFITTKIFNNETSSGNYFGFSEHNSNGKEYCASSYSGLSGDLVRVYDFEVSGGFEEYEKKTFFIAALYSKKTGEYGSDPRVLKVLKIGSDGTDIAVDEIYTENFEENLARPRITLVGNDDNEARIAIAFEKHNKTEGSYELEAFFMEVSSDNQLISNVRIDTHQSYYPFFSAIASTENQIYIVYSTTTIEGNVMVKGNLFSLENGTPELKISDFPNNYGSTFILPTDDHELKISLKASDSLFACIISINGIDVPTGAYGFTYDLTEKRMQYINNGFANTTTNIAYPILNDGYSADIAILNSNQTNKVLSLFYSTHEGGKYALKSIFLEIKDNEDNFYINSTSLEDYGDHFEVISTSNEYIAMPYCDYLPNKGFLYYWLDFVPDDYQVIRVTLIVNESSCSVGTYLDTSDLNCKLCAVRKSTVSDGAIGIDSCLCDKGYYLDKGNVDSCQLCLQNSYKDEVSNDVFCKVCPSSEFNGYGATDILNCTVDYSPDEPNYIDIVIAILFGVFGSILFVLVFFFLISLAVFLILYNKSRKKANRFDHIEGVDLILQEAEVEQNSQPAGVRVPKIEVKQSKHIIDYKELNILTKIGQGGSNSTVYKADWKGTICAFKAFSEGSIITSDLNNERSKYEEFEKEVAFCVGLNHPSILQFYGASVTPSRVGLVIQYCANGDLKSFLNKYSISHNQEKYPKKDKLRIIKQIILGLEYLHSRQLIHRDMKPENILIDEHENSKIMDFGLSKTMDSVAENTQTKRVGTIFYMAPEVIRGGNYSFPCDVFSFGIAVYVIFSENFYPYGTHTYESTVMKKVAEDSNFRPQINEMDFKDIEFLVPIIKKCWDVDPEERYTFTELKELLIRKEDNSK